MPVLKFSERFTKQVLESVSIHKLKKEHVKRLYKEFGDDCEIIKTEVIHTGDPDGLGELDDTKEFVIHSNAKITEEKAADLKKRADEKWLAIPNEKQ